MVMNTFAVGVGGARLHAGQRHGHLHVADGEVAGLAVQAALEPVLVHFADQRDHVVFLKNYIDWLG